MPGEGIRRWSHRRDAARSEQGHDEESDQPPLHRGVVLPQPMCVKPDKAPTPAHGLALEGGDGVQ